jgi:hypothetical protein
MTEDNRHISVIEPLSPAIDRVKEILFRPFDFPKWLAIGFCAWLAHLGGGANLPNFNYRENINKQNFSRISSEITGFFNEHWPVVIAIGVAVLILIIVVSVVLTWLRSRGQFMFLHCVVKGEAQIGEPWNRFSKEGNRLFAFNLVVGVISLIVLAILVSMIILFVLLIIEGGAGIAAGVIGLVLTVLLVICVSIVLALVIKFTTDFVVPIMYLRRCGPVESWRIFLRLLSVNKGKFFLYILFQIVIGIIIFIICYVLPCCLCCCGGWCVMLLLLLPYVWAVALLPILVFDRSYSPYYLRQFGSEFDVFIPELVVPLPQAYRR